MRLCQRNYEIEQLRQREINEINSKIDKDNEVYENFKKQRERATRAHEYQMHENALKQTEEDVRRERQFEDYRKNQLRKVMAESLEIKELNRRRQKMTEGEYDRRVMDEQRKILENIDADRNRVGLSSYVVPERPQNQGTASGPPSNQRRLQVHP